jgi:hypothetical protein
MTRAPIAAAVLAAASLAIAPACRQAPVTGERSGPGVAASTVVAAGGGGGTTAAAEGGLDASVLRTARCSMGPPVLSADGAGAPLGSAADLEIGDAVPFDAGYAIGVVHRTAAGRTAALALVDADGARAQVVDLGVTPGDAPPTRAARWGGGVLAASYDLPSAGAAGKS